MFYLLQTDPKYLARCIYVINPQQLESFLDTVILTLFGDADSPREEFLQLSLFQVRFFSLSFCSVFDGARGGEKKKKKKICIH